MKIGLDSRVSSRMLNVSFRLRSVPSVRSFDRFVRSFELQLQELEHLLIHSRDRHLQSVLVDAGQLENWKTGKLEKQRA